ncbi:L-threonylcarbamoyladenylate synthase [Candidatus Similichlamydia epinepheli]|uniref:L-threonylcarbamoyladenylate synthase n=1 Tax=Candidatus Similichlamydia epinepheli TaxID=1903953 RepID=UPI0013009BD5|nr:L-threonylcarbamoyladenylate synthase [Candidatus Similichlamydia epinepheli]
MRIGKEEAKKRLDSGEVIALPTDTVFGLAVRADKENARRRLLSIKGRPISKPFVTLLPCRPKDGDFLRKSIYLPSAFRYCCDMWWPGPCTMLLPISESIEDPSRKFDGFRVPRHIELQTFLYETGDLLVSSANLSGAFPSVSFEEVENIFGKDFPCLDFGTNRTIGIESTVLKFSSDFVEVVREGLLPLEEICSVCDETFLKKPSLSKRKMCKKVFWIDPRKSKKEGGVLIGFSNRSYQWNNKILLGSDSSIEGVMATFYSVLKKAFDSSFNPIFIDMNWPTSSPLWEVLKRKLLELTNNGSSL